MTIASLTDLTSENAAIWLEDASRAFGDTLAADSISLAVPRGSIFGFIGPSGSGKTTTVRMMTGGYAPTSGDVYVLGNAVGDFGRKQRAQIAYMPQLFVLYPHLSIWENLNFVASIYGMPYRNRKARFDELLAFVELAEHKHKLARNISGGMQRRLSLAATLINNPQLSFLDEPTAGIDPVLRRKFWEHFATLKAQGRTLFVTTQYVGEAAYCDYVGVLAKGRLLTVDTPDGLRQQAFGGGIVNITTEDSVTMSHIRQLQALDFVQRKIKFVDDLKLQLTVRNAASDMTQIVGWFTQNDISIVSIEEYHPPFDDVFIELVSEVMPLE